MNHTELNEFSFANDKRDLKYYQNLIKIVGKQHCFILIAKDQNSRDLLLEQINTQIDSIKSNSEIRQTLLEQDKGQKEKVIDIEFICTEWQGEKMVYILEIR